MMKLKFAVVAPVVAVGVLMSWPFLKVIFGGHHVPALVPLPRRLEARPGAFDFGPGTRILADAPLRETAGYLREALRKATSLELPAGELGGAANPQGAIVLTTNSANPNLGAEGYQLTATTGSIRIRAPQAAGAFYGVQSLLQLLPPEALASRPSRAASWDCPRRGD